MIVHATSTVVEFVDDGPRSVTHRERQCRFCSSRVFTEERTVGTPIPLPDPHRED